MFFFSFKTVEIGGIEKEINNINPKKTTNSNSIPPKIFKKSSKVSARVLHKTLYIKQIMDLLAYYP